MRGLLAVLIIALFLAMPLSLAHPHQEEHDVTKDLPVTNIYDPVKKKNKPITDYTYSELAHFMNHYPAFRRWSDMPAVCESIRILHGRAPPECSRHSVKLPSLARPSTAKAYAEARIEILPPPASFPLYSYPPRVFHQPVTVITDPVYYPWAPANNGWW